MDTMAAIQNIFFVALLDFFFSIIEYDQYNIPTVRNTNTGLYLVIFEKYALPNAPKPRGANIRPPVQHRVANIDVNIDNTLSTFSFIIQPPNKHWGLSPMLIYPNLFVLKVFFN